MYCMEVEGVTGASFRRSHFVILFLTLVVHNSVVYAVLYVTRKKCLVLFALFLSHLEIFMRKFLKRHKML